MANMCYTNSFCILFLAFKQPQSDRPCNIFGCFILKYSDPDAYFEIFSANKSFQNQVQLHIQHCPPKKHSSSSITFHTTFGGAWRLKTQGFTLLEGWPESANLSLHITDITDRSPFTSETLWGSKFFVCFLFLCFLFPVLRQQTF